MLRLIKATLALRLALAILTRWRRPAPPPPAPAPAARPAPSAKPDGRRVFSVVALLVVSVVGVVVLLRTDSPPPAYERKEIVFKPPAAGLPDRAFTAAMSVSAYGCDKRADVALVYAASAEYWIDHRGRLGERPKFSVELPPGVSEVRVGVTDALDSFHPFGLGVPPRKTRRLRYTLTTTGRGHTRVRGSLRNWARKWDALKLTFNVDWGSARTLGTCYLQVPELVGEGNVAFLPPYLRRNDLTARLERLTRDPTSESPARLRRIARDLLGASGSNSADHVSFGVVRVLPVQGEG